MVNELVRSGIGILGSGCGLLMYGAPVLTIRKVMKRKSSDSFSGVPYVIALFNCLVYSWYGSPFISEKWENMLVLAINGIGLVFQCCFLGIHLFFASSKPKIRLGRLLFGALVLFGGLLTCSILVMKIEDHKHKKLLVGSIGMAATVTLYASPLSDTRTVIRTKNPEYMPFYFTLFATLGSIFWLFYGILSKDIVIMVPNFIGVAVGGVQMIIYFIYKAKAKAGGDVSEIKEQNKNIMLPITNDETKTQEIKIETIIIVDVPMGNKDYTPHVIVDIDKTQGNN